jgi:CYTH domain-containing protein
MRESLEIERVFLLRGMPALPASRDSLEIEQGYLATSDGTRQGRIRRTTFSDGRVLCHLNMKTGSGRVRQEREGEISREEFDRDWPMTAGRRIRKRRHRVSEGELLFEVDEFLDFPLVLAEVELPSIDHDVRIPAWLSPLLVREVSDDSRYHNYALALHGPPDEGVPR